MTKAKQLIETRKLNRKDTEVFLEKFPKWLGGYLFDTYQKKGIPAEILLDEAKKENNILRRLVYEYYLEGAYKIGAELGVEKSEIISLATLMAGHITEGTLRKIRKILPDSLNTI